MAEAYDSPELRAAVEKLVVRSGRPGPEMVTVSLGGCVDAWGTSRIGAMRRRAHAHTHGRYFGTICFKSSKPAKLVTATGQPTRLLAHEWAHLAVKAGHTAAWRELMRKLGHPAVARRYEQRRRRPLIAL